MDDAPDGGAPMSALERPLDELGVELVHWPRDEVLRRRLARAGVARLLLVEQDAAAPTAVGVDEDWIRLPADERELWTRAERLCRLSAALDRELPVLHEGRVLTHGAGTVVLSKSEAVVIRLLLDSIGNVVPRQVLDDALWPAGAPRSGRALDALIERLRRRIVGLHLCIRSVRTKGFLIYMDGA
jgi:two-component system OmpR family response regulator